MAQIFRPSADVWLRIAVGIAVIAGVGVFFVAGGYVRSDYATGMNWVAEQPVPFSHQHHVAGLGIDCRYCHATVETSAEAGYPPTQVCMSCHSQVWTNAAMLAPVRQSLADNQPLRWHRVAAVPDYVYFSHEIHIHAGVGCETCHGRVDQMPLTYRAHAFEMHWCLDCHRDPATHVRPRSEVTAMAWPQATPRAEGMRLMSLYGVDTRTLTDCYTCHR